jgi:hypothetical protein
VARGSETLNRGIAVVVTRIGLLAAALALLLPAAATGQTKSNLSGTVTITGSQGRDNLEIDVTSSSPSSVSTLTITPSAAITATRGNCPPDTDPLTGRPVRNVCVIDNVDLLALDLQGGDDVLALDAEAGAPISAVTAQGGIGNDTLSVGARAQRTLRGADGDDSLRAPGRTGNEPVVFDGGIGRDLAGFGGASAASGVSNVPSGTDLGVSASLVSNQATLSGRDANGAVVVVRTDSLVGIERLEGTDAGDILTGAVAADELIGGDGPDNLRGGSGTDLLSGGQGLDDLNGGRDADTLDGGTEIDTYARGDGLDTYLTRDGFAEVVTCVRADVVVNDLADRVDSVANCQSVSTAQAKHRYDTVLSKRPPRVAGDGTLRVRLRCPALKTEACEGTLAVLPARSAAAKPLGETRYKLKPGRSRIVALSLTTTRAKTVRGKVVDLQADEIDADGRARKVTRRLRISRR